MNTFSEADLILNSDGSVYHLGLLPEQVADTIIVVGDPTRVARVSGKFDSVEFQTVKREFVTHTGYYKEKRITVLSTGIGPHKPSKPLRKSVALLYSRNLYKVVSTNIAIVLCIA